MGNLKRLLIRRGELAQNFIHLSTTYTSLFDLELCIYMLQIPSSILSFGCLLRLSVPSYQFGLIVSSFCRVLPVEYSSFLTQYG